MNHPTRDAHFAFFMGLVVALLLGGCSGIPDGTQAVTNFELDRYLGKWYEVARLDHSFERGLENVTATYALREDGGVSVTNRGYNPKKGEWEEAIGKAYFVSEPEIGRLKVSFFGPFYGGYNILELDRSSYQYALVAGPSRKFLWILAREPNLNQARLERLVKTATALDFPTDELIFVNQSFRENGNESGNKNGDKNE